MGQLQAGCQNKPTVFLFDETQIVQETFLEDINNILTSGECFHLCSYQGFTQMQTYIMYKFVTTSTGCNIYCMHTAVGLWQAIQVLLAQQG